jgi:hypothetical protein
METSRRLFLGSTLAAAMPVTINWSAIASVPEAASARDIVLDHVGRELAATFNACRSTGTVRGEHLRTVAANLRLLSSHARETGSASRADAVVMSRIRQRGRAAVAAERPAATIMTRLHRDVAALGVTVTSDEFRRALSSDDIAGRERTLEYVQRRGTAELLADVAAALERTAHGADSSGHGIALARARQIEEACWQMSWQLLMLETTALAMALAAPYAAAQIAAAALFLRFYMSLYGCP